MEVNATETIATNPLNDTHEWTIDSTLEVTKRIVLVTQASVGFIANLLVIAVVSRAGKQFPKVTGTFLKNQAASDAMVCLFGFIIGITGDTMLTTKNYLFDAILCYTLNNQQLFYLFVFSSSQSLVCLACERYLAVCKPFIYLQVRNSKSKHALAIVCVYLYSLLITLSINMQLTNYSSGVCITFLSYDTTSDGSYSESITIYIWFTLFFCLPLVTLCILYMKVIIGLRRSIKLNMHSQSSVLTTAASQITRTSLIVTLLFILLIGFESCFFILGFHNIWVYDLTLLFVSNILIIANSVANPFIYVIMMPIFRKSITKSVCCQGK